MLNGNEFGNEIEYYQKNWTIDDIKNKLLNRNREWEQNKDGSSSINNSLNTLILSCMDSRVPVEKIFKAKPGEILVLKNAGNEITKDVVRSILVGIYEIHTDVIIIMGHTLCGMAVAGNEEKLEHLKKEMGETVLKNIENYAGKEPFEWLGFFEEGKWEENAKTQAEQLNKILHQLVPDKKIPEILIALYDVETGSVKFI